MIMRIDLSVSREGLAERGLATVKVYMEHWWPQEILLESHARRWVGLERCVQVPPGDGCNPSM